MGIGLSKKPEEKKPEEKKLDGKPRGPPKKYVNVNWSLSHLYLLYYSERFDYDLSISEFKIIWIIIKMIKKLITGK